MRAWRAVKDPMGFSLISRVRRAGLTYLDADALADLRDAAREVERREVAGEIVEAGCALGGSAIMLAASKKPVRRLRIFDVFGMIPPPGERDGADVHERYETIASGQSRGIRGATYYGYEEDLLGTVQANFARFGQPMETSNVEAVKGLFEDTLQPDGPVALAHVDSDWHESVKVCLERIWPVLVEGGRIVIDDYDAWSGCRTAVDEFIAHEAPVVERLARVHLVKR